MAVGEVSPGGSESGPAGRSSARSVRQQKILCLVDLGGQVIGAAPVRVELLHELAVCRHDGVAVGAFFQTQNIEGLLPRHAARGRLGARAAP